MDSKSRRGVVVLSGLIAIVAVTGGVSAEEVTSETSPQLKQALQRFPDADANGDGVLTQTEARVYREKMNPRRAPAGRNGANQGKPAATYANVHYGPDERQVLDVYLADSKQPTPLLIYIHGGGFVGGDKGSIAGNVVARCHEAGVSVAAIHYRFVTTDPFPVPQQDAARAVQFLRSQAGEWNLDPQRFGAYGGSAGAGLSMWLGFHDDLADPDSDDPVARESTRLKAVGSIGGQSTYDPQVIKAWIGGRAYEHPSIYKCYNITSIDEIADPKLQPVYDEVSAIKHLTADDPPVFMLYSEADAPLPADARPGQGIHHPIFGHKLKAEMDRLGIESRYVHTSERNQGAADMLEYLLRWLKA
ncbi:MAG: alpha/beta hydrolase fold domain-containing protein [Planctomycetaceae bacterium]|nr:alpha/beta hydrolase fold domain-containing protein [Planctomycetaceae bacterium]